MQRYPSVLTPVEQDESQNWRTLALGIAALLAQMPEQQEGVVSVVARQLKTPVATLRAHAARLEEQAAGQIEPEAAHEIAGRIVEQADLMAEWVGAILDVQRIRLGKLALSKSRLDLVKLARASADHFRQKHPDIALNVVHSGPLAEPVLADHGRLGQVLEGVLRNAAQYAPGRPIEVRVARRQWSDGHPRAVLIVSHRGRDLDDDDLRRIQSGQTDVSQDQDLDLYVAREIVRLHGGTLWTEPPAPDAGAGTVTILVLPLVISHGSHTVLARGGPCLATRQAR
jgi:signal transduction histidine kinase